VTRASIGDNLFAIGRDETGANLHVWTGVVYSVFQEVLGKELDTEDVPVGSFISTYLKTSGGQVMGMSGAPVFNGCGLSGVSTGIELRYENIGSKIVTSFLGPTSCMSITFSNCYKWMRPSISQCNLMRP